MRGKPKVYTENKELEDYIESLENLWTFHRLKESLFHKFKTSPGH